MKYVVTLNGKKYDVEVNESEAVITSVSNAAPAAAPVAPVAAAPAPAASTAPSAPAAVVGTAVSGTQITSPMPGTILKLNVAELIIAETGIPGNDIKSGRLTPEQWRHLESATKPLGAAPLYIDDTPALSVFEFRSKARRLKIHNDIQIIIIDYLQLMTGGTQDSKGNREQEVAFISRTLKAIAKELNVPIIALSQLSRATELRGGSKRPQLSDLRESGAIEQDADIVAFIHRPEYYGINQDENGEAQHAAAA